MNALYLISIIVSIAFQNVLKKQYNEKTSGRGVYIFNGMSAVAALVFFAVTSDVCEFPAGLLPYAATFAASYAVALAAITIAIGCGSLSVTSLIFSFSLLIPTVYGILFLKEPIGAGFLPGLVLLTVSLFLVNQKSDHTKISLKWCISVFLAFVGNGMCSVIQKKQQMEFDGNYKGEFMIEALVMVAIILGIFAVLYERKNGKTYIKKGWALAILCGIMNGIVNLFVMILTARMPVSLMFPLISAGGIVVTYLASRTIYKENLTKSQLIGFLLGIGAIIFLNL